MVASPAHEEEQTRDTRWELRPTSRCCASREARQLKAVPDLEQRLTERREALWVAVQLQSTTQDSAPESMLRNTSSDEVSSTTKPNVTKHEAVPNVTPQTLD
ncbi:hypothetical protein NDU88_007117 [Pleurodeles waltl]|uniref:Uncharacterized protein n=1 Tax=Pleurodeles waltl TaxID=8319 RepID=A0AAV7QNX3_PLEWA|nr:hypothetical protein NDU88_007117 [Pleurodeles waltl]